jgi:beta-glucosidase
VQVYVADVESTVNRPVRELKGFAKVFLPAGATESVTIELDQRAFAFWSTQLGQWAVEAGDFVIGVGSNSRDLPLTETVVVAAPRLARPLSRDSTLQEWMDDPIGRQLIEREIANGQPASAMGEEFLAVIGNMPMSTLANFDGMSLDHDALDDIVQQWQQEARSPSNQMGSSVRSR